MRAPILLRQSATSTISGSRAALSMTVVPLASAAAIIAVWVPPTVTLGNTISPPFSPFGALRHDVAAVDLDLGAELLHRHDEQIDRPRADGAAARHRHPRLAHAREQRRHHPEAGAHLRDELVGRGGVDDVGRGNVQRLAVIGGLARPLAAHHHVDAVIAEDALQQDHVGEPRHVVEDERLLGEQARDHQRQRGVLGARNRNGAVKPPAADDANAIHAHPLRPVPGFKSARPKSARPKSMRPKRKPAIYDPDAAGAQSATPRTVSDRWRSPSRP